MIKKANTPTREELLTKQEQYQKELNKRLTPINTLESMELNNLAQKIKTDLTTATKKICTIAKKKDPKISHNTMKLMQERRKLDKSTQEYKILNKTIKKEIRKDIRIHNTNVIEKCIEDNANMNILKSKLTAGRTKIVKLKNAQGIIISDKNDVIKVIENFYTHHIPLPNKKYPVKL